ncbi:SCO7613 C-terminal domain-containing membrane protein [Aeromicrobium sp.]|uniref:SCO7613 C-terminal domain-containing membrane protein n=1 Tax=Aeromicrobium sp. TaxID=1871063 RepID=UPI003C65063F
MGFADASVCPSCHGRIEQARTCPHCGLDLTTHEIQQAWQALVVADQWVERARGLHAAGAPDTAPAAPSMTAQVPQAPPTAAPPPPRRTISTGSVLLGLGALFILVAGSIFISVSWGSLGVLGRALVLLAVTALIGALGSFVTRRGLRASSEAVWTVFLGLLTLDWFAARDQGLAGLDTWPFGASASAWAALVIVAALLVVPVGRRRLGKELMAPSIVAGSAAWFAAGSLAAELSDALSGDNEFWPAVLATAVVAAVGLVLRRGSARVGAWICVAGAAFFGLFAVGFAVAEAFEHPSLSELVVDAHGLSLALVVVAAIAAGVLVERARLGASAIALAGVATLIALPVEEAWPERGGYVVVAGLVVAAAWLFTAAGPWFQGARVTVLVGGAGLALATAPWVGRLMAVAAEGATAPRADDLTTRLVPDSAPETGAWWVAALVTVGLAVAVVGARRWPESGDIRVHVPAVASCIAVVGAWAVLATFDPAAVLLGVALVAGGALLAVLPGSTWWRLVGPAVVALAPLSTLSSWPAAVIIWPAAALVLAVIAMQTQAVALRCAAAFVAAGWGLGTVGPALELIDGDDRWTALALVVAALVGLAVSLFAVRDDLAHLGVEIASASLCTVGLVIGSSVSTIAFAALAFTIAGVGVVVLGLTSARRTWYRWVGSGLLGVAYVLRLAASDVDVVEAYTLPFAAFLLAVGLWTMRKEETIGSVRALLPGVALALLPSLPQALDEPTSLRALLLGIGAALALAVGTWRRWQVPFVGGGFVLTLLVLVNVGPPALALPRWVLIASAGALLLAAGITWDDRVRDGRAAIRYVGSMR